MKRAIILAALLLAPGLARAEGAAPKLPQFDFEAGVEGWASLSASGQVKQTAIADAGRAPSMGLLYSYEAKKDALPVLFVPLEGLQGMGSFRFDVSTDSPTLLAVALVEEGEARYQYVTSTPAAGWSHIEVDLSELARADDSPDANNRLDLDQVRAVIFTDLRAILTAGGNPAAKLFGERTGAHSFRLDNVVAAPERILPPAAPGELVIDDFRRDNVPWMPLEGVTPSVGPAPAEGQGRALRLDYNTAQGKLAAVIRLVPPGALAGMQRLAFSAAAAQDSSLTVVVEEIGGARYLSTFFVAKGGHFQRFAVPFDAMTRADDTPDANGHLDLEQVKSIGFVDLAGLTGAPPAGKSTFWLQDVRAQPAAPTR